MSYWDWGVLIFTLMAISLYGIYRGHKSEGLNGFLRAGQSLPWYYVGLSVMATQASAITFLAGPGFGYAHGLKFIQFYLGLPLAVWVLCISFVPNFYRLNVYTAYEYLESRFDAKTRALTSLLFLILRALSTAISVYAPALILSAVLPIPSYYSTLLMGVLVITYTLIGGSKAVSYTQAIQMLVVFTGLFSAIFITLKLLPPDIHLKQALQISGALNHLQAIDFHWDLTKRYTIWSGIIGGFFLQLSYFGTDQSQVGRYLTGSSIKESKMGLMMNGIIKIPMQFLILMTGVLVFVFYQFNPPPLAFNPLIKNSLEKNSPPSKIENPLVGEPKIMNNLVQDQNLRLFENLENKHKLLFEEKKSALYKYLNLLEKEEQNKRFPWDKEKYQPDLIKQKTEVQTLQNQMNQLEQEAVKLNLSINKNIQSDDSNYVFLTYILKYLPKGLVGALIAIIFLSSMGAVSAALNSMASCSIVDIYKRWIKPQEEEKIYVLASRWFTLFWGVVCVILALVIGKFDNLIEAVNIIGSYVYGPILGVFLVAFYFKKIGANAIFFATILSELMIILIPHWISIAYLWLNVIGSIFVILLGFLLESTIFRVRKSI